MSASFPSDPNDFKEYKMTNAICPSCAKPLDGAAGGDQAPAPGDFSICIYCATILKFDKNLDLEVLSQKELQDLDPEDSKILMHIANLALKIKHSRRFRNS